MRSTFKILAGYNFTLTQNTPDIAIWLAEVDKPIESGSPHAAADREAQRDLPRLAGCCWSLRQAHFGKVLVNYVVVQVLEVGLE